MVCETFQIPGGSDGGGSSGGGGGGTQPNPPQQEPPSSGSADLGGPNVEGSQTSVESAQIEFSVTNNGSAKGSMTVVGTIDLGANGEIDAQREKVVEVGPQSIARGTFEFVPSLNSDTEAILCVKEA
jgi:hypothetical protein